MSDRLREALKWWEYGSYKHIPVVDEHLSEIIAAARRFLALTETGPDYEAAAKWMQAGWEADRDDDDEFGEPPYEWDELDPIVRKWWVDTAKGAVDAALADYLTEEETE